MGKKLKGQKKLIVGEGNTITAKLLSRKFICQKLIFINTHIHTHAPVCMGLLMLQGKK